MVTSRDDLRNLQVNGSLQTPTRFWACYKHLNGLAFLKPSPCSGACEYMQVPPTGLVLIKHP